MLPALLAVSSAMGYDVNWWLAATAVVGVVCAHLGMNLADDYFDYRNGVVERMSVLGEDSIRRRMEKCHYIASGSATVRELMWAMVGFVAVAVACGVVITVYRGWVTLVLMGAGGVIGLSYSGGPLRLSFRGLGELTIGLLFGPLLMMGVQWSACGVIDWNIVLMSVAVGLLVTNIVYTHSVIDAENDTKSQKMTFARLLGSHGRQLSATTVFVLLPFVMVYAAVAAGWWHWSYLAVSVLLPLALFLIGSIRGFLSGAEGVSEPRWWMGLMGNWEAYREAGIDWFLIRWLPARNLVTFFCLIILVANVILSLCK